MIDWSKTITMPLLNGIGSDYPFPRTVHERLRGSSFARDTVLIPYDTDKYFFTYPVSPSRYSFEIVTGGIWRVYDDFGDLFFGNASKIIANSGHFTIIRHYNDQVIYKPDLGYGCLTRLVFDKLYDLASLIDKKGIIQIEPIYRFERCLNCDSFFVVK